MEIETAEVYCVFLLKVEPGKGNFCYDPQHHVNCLIFKFGYSLRGLTDAHLQILLRLKPCKVPIFLGNSSVAKLCGDYFQAGPQCFRAQAVYLVFYFSIHGGNFKMLFGFSRAINSGEKQGM